MRPIPLHDPMVQTLIAKLSAQNLRARHLPPGPPQAEDQQLFLVRKHAVYNYPALQCWHNCRIHALTNTGQVIYGWSLYHGNYGGIMCWVAQHHAVWRDGSSGQYIDVTPEANLECITFYADSRLQIGHEQTIWTPSLFYLNDEGHRWITGLDANARMQKDYFETKMRSQPFAIKALGLLPP